MLYCLKVEGKTNTELFSNFTIFNSDDYSINTYKHQQAVKLYLDYNSKIKGLKYDKVGFGSSRTYMYQYNGYITFLRYKRLNNWFVIVSKKSIDIYYKAKNKVTSLILSDLSLEDNIGDCIYKPNSKELYLVEFNSDRLASTILHFKYNASTNKITYDLIPRNQIEYHENQFIQDVKIPKFLSLNRQLEINGKRCYKFFNQLTDSYVIYNSESHRWYTNNYKELDITGMTPTNIIKILKPAYINQNKIQQKVDEIISKCKYMNNPYNIDTNKRVYKYLYFTDLGIILTYILNKDKELQNIEKQLAQKLNCLGYRLDVHVQEGYPNKSALVIESSLAYINDLGTNAGWVYCDDAEPLNVKI